MARTNTYTYFPGILKREDEVTCLIMEIDDTVKRTERFVQNVKKFLKEFDEKLERIKTDVRNTSNN